MNVNPTQLSNVSFMCTSPPLGCNVRNVRCNAGPPRGVITRVVTRAPTRTLHITFDPYRTARTRTVPSDDKKRTSTEIFQGMNFAIQSSIVFDENVQRSTQTSPRKPREFDFQEISADSRFRSGQARTTSASFDWARIFFAIQSSIIFDESVQASTLARPRETRGFFFRRLESSR